MTPSRHSADSAADSAEPREALNRGRGSLLRVELARISARRFIRILLGLAVLGFVILSAVAFTQFSRPTPQSLAEAETQRDADIAASEEFREDCLADESIPEEERELRCGPPLTADQIPIEAYLDKSPFTLADDLPAGALGVAGAAAALGFVIGATYIGAEWSSRSIVALLFWEPRRLRVLGVKTTMTVLVATVLGVVSQLAWIGVGLLLARSRGTPDTPDGFWADTWAQSGRSVLLVVIAALLGFGVANLIRNTGAALGVGFAYFAIVETAVRALLPSTQAYLLTDNAVALAMSDGLSIFIPGPAVVQETGSVVEFTEFVLTNLRGGVTLAAYCLVLLAIGTWLFRRRDLQ